MANNDNIVPKRTEGNFLDLTLPKKTPPSKPTKSKFKPKVKLKLTRSGIVVVLVLILVIGIAYFNARYQSARREIKKLSAASQVSKEQTDQLQDKVGKLVELPKNETPTIATVTDISKLKDQPFFANAQNDDQVLIYTQAKRAVLYRPSTNKIIEVGPVNLGDGGTTTKPN